MGRFIGGPCNGRTSPPPTEAFRDCGGSTYFLLEDGNYHIGGVPITDNLDTKQIGKAWHRLMSVYAVEAPAAIRRSTAARGRLRRLSR